MHESRNIAAEKRHDAVWELIPWFVNGTLPPEDMTLVKQHSQTCPECAAEIARQHGLARNVAAEDPFEAPLSRSWETLRAQIEAEQEARTPQADTRRWYQKRRGGMMLGGMGLAACLVAVFMIGAPNDDFRTLTSSDPSAVDTVRFQMVPGTTPEAIAEILSMNGLILVDGPSEAGVYTAEPLEGTDIDTATDSLKSAPEIVFAAPGQ